MKTENKEAPQKTWAWSEQNLGNTVKNKQTNKKNHFDFRNYL